MSENEQNYARAGNSGITKEDRERLVILIDRVKLGEDTHLIHQFFNQLLAAKDARIAALESRQITPEMEAWFNAAKAAYDQAEEAMFLKRLMRLMGRALKGDKHE